MDEPTVTVPRIQADRVVTAGPDDLQGISSPKPVVAESRPGRDRHSIGIVDRYFVVDGSFQSW